MEIITVILTATLSLIILFVITKVSGNKQISELTMFDYIIGITIGSIAAEFATDLENFIRPLTAMLVYGTFSPIFSIICEKSIRLRRIIFGRSMILYRNKKIYRKNLRKARMDISEFLMQCRIGGYFDLSELDCVISEPNGKLSFLPFAQNRPATPADLKIVPEPNPLNTVVILDGKILSRNLKNFSKDEKWLESQLNINGFSSAKEVCLCLLDKEGKIKLFPAINEAQTNDIYE